MDVMTATADQEKSMTIFTIDSENNIAAHASESEITDKGSEQFTSEKELAQLAAAWRGIRLIDIWNRIPGVMPVKRFTNRAVAIARIWKAVQALVPAEDGGVALARRRGVRKPTRKQHAPTGRKNTKQAQVVALLKRSGGTTLNHLMSETGWQAHSVRGFISGALGKKLRLKIESFKTPRGERAYRIG